MTQQELAVRAFGNESYKTTISKLENGRILNPHQKTIDRLVVALNIQKEELSGPFNVDTVCDFVRMGRNKSVAFEVTINDKKEVVIFHDRPWKVPLKRGEYFAEDRDFVFCAQTGSRRPLYIKIAPQIHNCLIEHERVLVVLMCPETNSPLAGAYLPLKVIW